MNNVLQQVEVEIDNLNASSIYWLVAMNLRTLDQKIVYVANELQLPEDEVRAAAKQAGY